MESHKRTLGIIYIVTAVLQGLLMLLFGFILSFIIAMVTEEDSLGGNPQLLEFVIGVLSFIPFIIIIFCTIPSLVAGIGLLSEKSWAMTLALVVGCLRLLSFPIGTAIGIYALWIYFEDKKHIAVPPNS